jgi:succinoglycan biosynthesis transport protein ExoP
MNAITGPEPGPSSPVGKAPVSIGRATAGSPQLMRASGAGVRSNGPDALGLLRAFQRRWRLAVGLGIIAALIAGVSAYFLVPPPKFTAETLISVEPVQPTLIVATKEYRADPETDRKTQIALIKSAVVLGKALGQTEVTALPVVRKQTNPAEWLEGQLKAEFSGKLLRIALTAEKASDATVLVKAVTSAYLSEVVNAEKAQRIERNHTLERHYEKLQTQLESKRRKLKTLATALGSKDKQTLSLQQRLAIGRQSVAEEELIRTQASLTRAMAELKVRQQALQGSATASEDLPAEEKTAIARDVEEELRTDPEVLKFLELEQSLKTKMEDFGRVVRKRNDTSLVIARKELAKIQRQRRDYEARKRAELLAQTPGSPNPASPKSAKEARSELSELESEVGVLKEMERELKIEVGQVSEGAQKLGAQAIEMESIQDEIKSADEIAKTIGHELEALKIELNAPDRIHLLEAAKLPPPLDGSKKVQLTGMASFGAFAAVVFLISFLEFQAKRVSSVDEVTHGLGIRIVGTMPAIPERGRGAIKQLPGSRQELWQHQLIESIDATRILLTQATHSGPHRVVLVTSAVGGEGKTSLASHLATSIARSGRRTLIIDGDFRRPMLHRLYDQPPGPGLCEVLRGEQSIEDVARPTIVPNLWMISGGEFDDRAQALLSLPPGQQLFERLRAEFDFVVVDSAPVLPVADTLLLGPHVDAAIFAILRGTSQLPKIHSAQERLSALGVPIVGAVVAGTQTDTYYRY